MIFYIEPKGEELIEFMAENGEYIGTLNSPDSEAKILEKSDISIEKISNKLKENIYLACLIFHNTWHICIIANTQEAFNEIKTKYKSNQMLWYWIGDEYVKRSVPNIQYKNLRRCLSEK